ncbi:hypothetical protein [Sulfitobacter sp. SK025]|uniref:hypothetical protein n=1 Tax=Sulfitobacter sp. SK025 TaxID=1389011 RepID=UPI000E0A7D60|nr:hypothetical protein [Sulfitobacter sp. SK025]AXI50397.1 hypothetical protein C1J04_05505 [Sulfitobacter sp. SK025]
MIRPTYYDEGREVKFQSDDGVPITICSADPTLPFPELVASEIADALNAKSAKDKFHDDF